MEKMKSEHCFEPQNPLIANVLYKRKLLDNWERGISLMAEECKKAGLPEPEMMGLTQLKDRESFLNNYLNPSINAGWVESLYPHQPKLPKQKYRLTEKGKALLKKKDSEKRRNNKSIIAIYNKRKGILSK